MCGDDEQLLNCEAQLLLCTLPDKRTALCSVGGQEVGVFPGVTGRCQQHPLLTDGITHTQHFLGAVLAARHSTRGARHPLTRTLVVTHPPHRGSLLTRLAFICQDRLNMSCLQAVGGAQKHPTNNTYAAPSIRRLHQLEQPGHEGTGRWACVHMCTHLPHMLPGQPKSRASETHPEVHPGSTRHSPERDVYTSSIICGHGNTPAPCRLMKHPHVHTHSGDADGNAAHTSQHTHTHQDRISCPAELPQQVLRSAATCAHHRRACHSHAA